MNIIGFVDSVGRDAVYALRGMRRSCTVTVVVVMTLAMSIGANTAVFSVLDGVLPVVLGVATLLASYLPARQIVAVDPVEALRSE